MELEFEEERFRMSSSKLAIFRIPNPVTFSQIYFATIQYTVFTGTVCREFHLFLGLKTLPEPLTKRRKQIFVNYAVIAVYARVQCREQKNTAGLFRLEKTRTNDPSVKTTENAPKRFNKKIQPLFPYVTHQ